MKGKDKTLSQPHLLVTFSTEVFQMRMALEYNDLVPGVFPLPTNVGVLLGSKNGPYVGLIFGKLLLKFEKTSHMLIEPT